MQLQINYCFTKNLIIMNDREYVSSLGFVAGALSQGIERLPEYVVPAAPEVPEVSEEKGASAVFVPNISEGFSVQGRCLLQQGVKRTCGHSQKSTRVKHAEKK
ncbi:MAG: hypothetical protein IJ660_06535 [Alphaproteobacteria bacterium]|nr:hypothetical protein [Alphaproteobacteria bacterium]